jgi:hypothetical protein
LHTAGTSVRHDIQNLGHGSFLSAKQNPE